MTETLIEKAGWKLIVYDSEFILQLNNGDKEPDSLVTIGIGLNAEQAATLIEGVEQ